MADAKRYTRQMLEQTLASISIPRVMGYKIRFEGSRLIVGDSPIDLEKINRFQIVAIGKAARNGRRTLRSPSDAIPCSGVVAAPTPPRSPLPRLPHYVCGHPIPNAESESSKEILARLGECDENTLVFFLLSGGGSALAELPLVPGLELGEIQEVNRRWSHVARR
jgi:hydroxypyruvate reductase